MKLLSLVFCTILAVTGCNRQMDSSTYTSNSAAGVVLEGTVVSARAITIKDTDKLQDNALGGLAGGAVGGIAGNNAGKGKGNTAATAGGAIVGAVLGAMIQDQLSTGQGMEYIVKLDKTDESDETPDFSSDISVSRSSSVQNKLKNQIKTKGTASRMISVVQGMDTVYTPGQRVYVIYSDDRPRITAAN